MFKDWKMFAELMGITAIVASLIFVGMQMQQTQEIAIAEMNASTLANSIESGNALIENAETWVKGNAGDELTPGESVIYMRLLQNVNNRFYSSASQLRGLGLDNVADVEVVELAAFLYQNPGARRAWRCREERLRQYRGIVKPDEEVSSLWIDTVESMFAAFDGQAGLNDTQENSDHDAPCPDVGVRVQTN